jgi:hypothetical protein
MPPHRPMPNNPPNSEPHHSRRPSPHFSPHQQQPQSQSSTGKSFMSVMLPMYAVGIGIYMIYTLCKVFSKKNETNELNEEVLRRNENRIVWDAGNKTFVPLSTINDDDLNGVNLDADYVEFLRKRRSGHGDTHDINTTLNMVKTSLNNINTQIIQADKKGAHFPDDDLESLKLQLANTELKMAQILQQIEKLSSNDNQSQIDEADDTSKLCSKTKNKKKKKIKSRRNKRKSSSSNSSTSEILSEDDTKRDDVEELGSLDSQEEEEKAGEYCAKVEKCSADMRKRKPNRKESSSTESISASLSSEQEADIDAEKKQKHYNSDSSIKKDC